MSRTHLAVLAALIGMAVLIPAAQAAAQTAAPGQRVRVTLADPAARPVVGDLIARDDSGLVVGLDSSLSRRIPLGDVRRLEVRRGTRTGLGRGAEVGGFVGALGGMVWALATLSSAEHCHSSPYFRDLAALECTSIVTGNALLAVEHIVPATLIGGVSGALLGGGIGLLVRREVWQTAPAPAAPSVARARAAGRFLVGLSLRF